MRSANGYPCITVSETRNSYGLYDVGKVFCSQLIAESGDVTGSKAMSL